jgi:hypothetical protein
VYCDFDRQSVQVTGGGRTLTLRVRSDLARVNYAVQTALMNDFFARGFWPWTRNDGLKVQLAALQWLENHHQDIADTSRLTPYDERRVPSWMHSAKMVEH